MLLQRQKLLLTFLDALGGAASKMDLQKLMFLYSRQESEPSYEFVPYRFGCYSFTLAADLRRLAEKGFLIAGEREFSMAAEGMMTAKKHSVLPLQVGAFCRSHSSLRGDALVAEVYRREPYFAIRSEILEQVLPDKQDRQRVASAKPLKAKVKLLTIGYEGKSLEAYLNQLIRAGVTLLCDVRRNPLSRKFGFSRSTLREVCPGVGIRYEHLPELGIASEERRDLETQADYDALFESYEQKSLPLQSASLAKIREWITDGEAVALTCYELHPHQCHRHCVAEALEVVSEQKLVTRHL